MYSVKQESKLGKKKAWELLKKMALVKNGKIDFILTTAGGKRDFSVELSSTPS